MFVFTKELSSLQDRIEVTNTNIRNLSADHPSIMNGSHTDNSSQYDLVLVEKDIEMEELKHSSDVFLYENSFSGMFLPDLVIDEGFTLNPQESPIMKDTVALQLEATMNIVHQ